MTDSEARELAYLARRDAQWRLARCIGKPRFEFRSDALKAISHNLKSGRAHPYRCVFCGKFHIGTTIAPRSHGGGRDVERKNASHGGHV